ncbi:hypothetical protein [Longimicrobium sp.]|uniref:hypothetical protein n=1 Tax=Longimicrobium sp. TaxID=2029185 RepID=UPI002D7F812C|nr:hypothetical protein [Longimicrobium sp.]
MSKLESLNEALFTPLSAEETEMLKGGIASTPAQTYIKDYTIINGQVVVELIPDPDSTTVAEAVA